jgi:hypothetical protein
MFMRFFFILAGIVLFTSEAHALSAPPRSTTLSKYVEGIFDHVETALSTAPSGPGGAPCDAVKSEAEAARKMRAIFLGIDETVTEAGKDIERTACFRADAEALERYVRALFELALQKSQTCDTAGQDAYEKQAQYVWARLWNLRRLGLDPRAQAPLDMGKEREIPIGASPTDDNLLCPYNSIYALPTLTFAPPGPGCRDSGVPSTASAALQREASTLKSILEKSASLGGSLTLLEGTIVRILSDAADFVGGLTMMRPLSPPLLPTPLVLPSTPFANTDEAGCFGWPSEMGGVVSGENVSLENEFPFVLTTDLAEVFAYLREHQREPWFEYLTSLDRASGSGGALGQALFRSSLRALNQYHLQPESFSILTIRNTQKRLEESANILHEGTLRFARLATLLPGDPVLPEGPPLRAFARSYATFLSRMCINRGCQTTLSRAIELSLRDECFSSFLMHIFFQANPSASTLPACKALYVGS